MVKVFYAGQDGLDTCIHGLVVVCGDEDIEVGVGGEEGAVVAVICRKKE